MIIDNFEKVENMYFNYSLDNRKYLKKLTYKGEIHISYPTQYKKLSLVYDYHYKCWRTKFNNSTYTNL